MNDRKGAITKILEAVSGMSFREAAQAINDARTLLSEATFNMPFKAEYQGHPEEDRESA